jgi:hypothetical protein
MVKTMPRTSARMRWVIRLPALRVFVALALFCSAFGWSRSAFAGKIDDLIKQLKSDDFRVRTQAALALGASRDKAAVPPLCGALSDSNNSVKMAAAAGLGKLGFDSGKPCLKTAKGKEKDATVVSAIDKAIEKITLGGDPPPPGSSAKYYLALQVTNKTKRNAIEIEGVVRKAMQAKCVGNSSCAFAPRAETAAQGKEITTNKKLKGYLLIASVEAPNYSGGNLTVQLKVTMWTYPDKALKAEFGPKLKQESTPSEDRASEDVLMGMASETAFDSFMKVAASL